MAVDGGAGNTISFSEIQTFYGGSNPISISEYYRGGSEVPGDQVTAQSNTSGTADQTVGQFTVDVTSTTAFTGSLGGSTVRSQNTATSGTFVSTTYTVLASDAAIFINGGGTNHVGGEDGTEATGSHTTTRNGSTLYGSTSHSTTMRYRGPASDGTEFSGSTFYGSLSTGDVLVTTAVIGNISGYASIGTARRAGVTTHDVDFTNNNATTITTTSGSSGGAQTYTQNQTRKVKNDGSTSNWVLGYDEVLGNTNVPASGTINIDVFNAPGSAAP